MPSGLTQGRTVIVQGDTEFGTVEFLSAVRQRAWRGVTGMRYSRKLEDGRTLKQLYQQGKQGQQIVLKDMPFPLTVSWFWLKRADDKQELRFIVSTHPYSGAYLVRLGRRRWAIECFFKTIKHRFGLHRFGQSTCRGVYRWLILVFIAYLLAHWMDQWSWPPHLDWKQASDLALSTLFPSVVWLQLLKLIELRRDIATQFGFDIILKRIPNWAYRECCKI